MFGHTIPRGHAQLSNNPLISNDYKHSQTYITQRFHLPIVAGRIESISRVYSASTTRLVVELPSTENIFSPLKERQHLLPNIPNHSPEE